MRTIFLGDFASYALIEAAMLDVLYAFYYTIRLMMARFRDFDFSPRWMLGLWIPLLNILLFIFMMIKSGTKGDNRYGPPPSEHWRGKKLSPLLLVIVGIGMIVVGGGYSLLSNFPAAARTNDVAVKSS